MSDLERHLNELGVIVRPAAPKQPQEPRPDPRKSLGTWFRNGEDIPF